MRNKIRRPTNKCKLLNSEKTKKSCCSEALKKGSDNTIYFCFIKRAKRGIKIDKPLKYTDYNTLTAKKHHSNKPKNKNIT